MPAPCAPFAPSPDAIGSLRDNGPVVVVKKDTYRPPLDPELPVTPGQCRQTRIPEVLDVKANNLGAGNDSLGAVRKFPGENKLCCHDLAASR